MDFLFEIVIEAAAGFFEIIADAIDSRIQVAMSKKRVRQKRKRA